MKDKKEKSEPLDLEYFDDTLNLFYKNIDINEDLYNELHDEYRQNKGVGFSLGSTRGSVELAKVLAQLRSNAISGTSQLFSAKKSIAELEIKKNQQIIDKEKVDDSKDFIRTTLEVIHSNSFQNNREVYNTDSDNISSKNNQSHLASQKELDRILQEKLTKGDIKLTKNEKAMKYDYDNKAEVVLDSSTGNIKVVEKGTNIEIKDYPLERVNIGAVVRTDEKKAYTKDNKTIRIVENTK
jgi:hypothetical protein